MESRGGDVERKPVDVAERIGCAGRLGLPNSQIGKRHDSSPELSQVWIFDPSDVPFQQESVTHSPVMMNLKALVAGGFQQHLVE
jgi:hypothetical protein